MGIIINHEITEPRLNKETQAALLNLARRVLAAYGREGAEVGITLTDEETIHRLNREWRGVDAPTDVLSFPMAEEEPGLPMEPAGADDAPPELLGDVVICLPIALRQAAEYGHSSTREVLYLAVHGPSTSWALTIRPPRSDGGCAMRKRSFWRKRAGAGTMGKTMRKNKTCWRVLTGRSMVWSIVSGPNATCEFTFWPLFWSWPSVWGCT